MRVEYYHKNVTSLGEATRKYVEEKMQALEKLTSLRDSIIEVSQEKNGDFCLNVTLRAENGTEYRAEERTHTVNACIDLIQDELRQQIRRGIEKNRDLARRGGRSIKKKMTIDENARF